MHRTVFCAGGDDPVSPGAVSPGSPLQGEVDRFRRSAGEDDFLREGTDQGGNPPAGLRDCRFRTPAELVLPARRVSVRLLHQGEHRLDDPPVHARRGIIIKIDRDVHCFRLFQKGSWC